MKITTQNILEFLSSPNFMKESDQIYKDHINKSVEIILKNKKEKAIVLICGPSGAGKTTSAKNITRILNERGVKCNYVSMDNYFHTLHPEEVNAIVPADLEHPERVDFNLFNEQLKCLIDQKEIKMPVFDFKNAKRIDNQILLNRGKDDIVIVEGIHSLNSKYNLYTDKCTKLYLNVGCDIQLDNGSFYKGAQIRLLRRICRDRVYRARGIEDTIKQFKNVQRGEDLYIRPFKPTVDYVLSTFSYYEMSCYKHLLDDVLNEQYPEIVGAEEIFKKVPDIKPKDIPLNSHIREFV